MAADPVAAAARLAQAVAAGRAVPPAAARLAQAVAAVRAVPPNDGGGGIGGGGGGGEGGGGGSGSGGSGGVGGGGDGEWRLVVLSDVIAARPEPKLGKCCNS